MAKFAAAAKISLDLVNTTRGTEVTIHSQGTGYIHFRVRPVPAWVDVRLCYWQDEYWFEYVESYRFNAVPAANQIHKNYKGYLDRIEKELKKYYEQ